MEDNTSTDIAPISSEAIESTNTQASTETQSPATDPILAELTDTEAPAEKPSDETVSGKEAEATSEAELKTPDQQEAQPVDPAEEARRRYEERQRVRAEREARVRNQTQEYIQSAETELDQRLRTMEAQQYNMLIENNENTLVSEFERAKANPDLQIFNPESEKFNNEIYQLAIESFNSGKIDYDANGNMIGLKGSLYEHLKRTADVFNNAVKSGAIQQVRDTNKMRVTADVRPAAPVMEMPKIDPILQELQSD